MEIKIATLDQSPFSYEDVVNLMHSSFEERLCQGLCFTCSSMTVYQFVEKTSKSIILVAWQEQTLFGMVTLTLGTDSRGDIYGYHENLAVSPSAKRLGIGTKLQTKCVETILDAGGKYEMSDTAVRAGSSVRWHLKNGFKKIALRSYPSTNYYSYLFRKQLTYSTIWNSNLYCCFRLHISCMIVKLLFRENGSLTLFGRLAKKAFRR